MSGLRDEILRKCVDDEEGLWSVIFSVRKHLNLQRPDTSEVRNRTTEILRELLEAGLIQPIQYRSDSGVYEPWNLPVSDIIARISAEWDALGREPNPGDIVDFVATEKGERIVAEHKGLKGKEG